MIEMFDDSNVCITLDHKLTDKPFSVDVAHYLVKIDGIPALYWFTASNNLVVQKNNSWESTIIVNIPLDLSMLADLDDQGKIVFSSKERILGFIDKVKKIQAWM
jgi:hypothetical protein